MNQNLRNRLLFFFPPVALGTLTAVLHRAMLNTCLDEMGLLISGNPYAWALRGLVLAALVLLWLGLRNIGGSGDYEQNFPRCLWRGAMMTAAGVLLLVQVPRLGLEGDWQVALAYLAGGSMALLGVVRMAGRRAFFGPGAMVCVFYMLLLIGQYRQWSSSPKVYLYAFQLLALVLAMLCAFHRTCGDAGIFQRKKFLFTAFFGAFCAIAAMASAPLPGLYLATALWNMGCACSTAQLPEEPPEEPEEPLPTEEA